MSVPIKLKKLEKELLYLTGKNREEALKEYHKLLSPLNYEPIYFTRS